VIIALWNRDELAKDSSMDGARGWGGVTLAHNVTTPGEVDTILAKAHALGATIGRPGTPTSWGGYAGLFVDLDGHPWEIAHNPGWVFTEDRSVHLH
jgi:uncharacterized glyoxalase superfamily protein PhnB